MCSPLKCKEREPPATLHNNLFPSSSSFLFPSPDTYGRLTLLNSVGQEICRTKTSVRRGQPNPVYKETFIFQVALFQLSDVTLLISIYNRRSMKRKEMVGWIALGQNSSGDEELLHWQDMRDGRGQQVCRWHILLEAWNNCRAGLLPFFSLLFQGGQVLICS